MAGKLTIKDEPKKEVEPKKDIARPSVKFALPVIVSDGHEKYAIVDAVFVIDPATEPVAYDRKLSLAVARGSWERRMKEAVQRIKDLSWK